jgi:hypothetical protein
MAPYKVAVVPLGEATIELLVPASEELTVASLVDLALKRASKLSPNPLKTTSTTELRLNSATG